MQKLILESDWNPSGEIILEENATKAVKYHGNILIVAGPGAGKTELLAQKAGFLFQTNTCKYPQKILAISFKTDAAANLKERINNRYSQEYTTRFSSLTYDAYAKKILDQFRTALPETLRPNKNYVIGEKNIIDASFKKLGFVNSEGLTPNNLANYYDNQISNVQLPLDKKSRNNEVWKLLLKGFDNKPSCLTFKMISKLAIYILLTNPYILKSLRTTYSHVFLDEFQDTTNLQYELVKTCFHNSNSIITSVGDSKQRIMVWAGARKTVFEDFEQDFQAIRISLLMNHRSAPRLVKLQRLMYKSLQEPTIKLKTSSKWNEDDGNINLFISKNEDLEAQYIVTDIIGKISNGILLNDICILVKQRPENYTEVLVSKLADYNIKARIENEYQDLQKEFITNLIINSLIVAIKRRSPCEREFINKAIIELNALDSTENPDLYYYEQNCLIKLLNDISKNLNPHTTNNTFEQIVKKIINFFSIDKIKALYPVYSQGDFFINIVKKIINLLWNEFILSKDWIVAIENFLGLHSIPIMTIHKSKGLEYRAIYFIGLEDGAFWNFRNQSLEDRCAFFVALSRAKEYLSFSFCSYRHILKYPHQTHSNINEFFELLQSPNVSNIINCY